MSTATKDELDSWLATLPSRQPGNQEPDMDSWLNTLPPREQPEERPGFFERAGKTFINAGSQYLAGLGGSPGSMAMMPDVHYQKIRLEALQRAQRGEVDPIYDLPPAEGVGEKFASALGGAAALGAEIATMPGGSATRGGRALIGVGKWAAQDVITGGSGKHGAAMGTAFETIAALPVPTPIKIGMEMATLAGVSYALTGDTEEAIAGGLLGFFFGGGRYLTTGGGRAIKDALKTRRGGEAIVRGDVKAAQVIAEGASSRANFKKAGLDVDMTAKDRAEIQRFVRESIEKNVESEAQRAKAQEEAGRVPQAREEVEGPEGRQEPEGPGRVDRAAEVRRDVQQVGGRRAAQEAAQEKAPELRTDEQIIADNISKTGKPIEVRTPGERARDAETKMREVLSDETSALESAVNRAKKLGIKVDIESDPFLQYEALKNSAKSLSDDAVRNGVVSLVTTKRLSGSLVEAFSKIPNLTKKRFETFMQWSYARHGLDAWEKGKNPGTPRDVLQRMYDKYKDEPGWNEANADMVAWRKAHITMLEEVGFYGKEEAARLRDSYPHALPLRRVMEAVGGRKVGGGRGIVQTGRPIKRFKGSERQVLDPLTSMMQESAQMYDVAAKTKIHGALEKLASEPGMEWLAENIPPQLDFKTYRFKNMQSQLKKAGVDLSGVDLEQSLKLISATGFYRGGEPIAEFKGQWRRYDPGVYDAVASLNPVRLPMWANIALWPAKKVTKSVRLGAVVMRPSFGLGMNPARDIQHGSILTKTKGVLAPERAAARTIKNYITGFWRAYKDVAGKKTDPVLAAYERFGGKESTFLGQDYAASYKTAREVVNEAAGHGSRNVTLHPFAFVKRLLLSTELGPRQSEMEGLLKEKGYIKQDLIDNKVPMSDMLEIVLGGKQITINFSRRGLLGAFTNPIKAFSNVAIQGPAQTHRQMGLKTLNPANWSGKRFAETSLRATARLTVPSLLLWWHNRDKDWYRELPAWRKTFFWNFGPNVMVPRPFELGVMFASIPEMVADSLYRTDPWTVYDMMRVAVGQQLPDAFSALPDILDPIVGVLANYDSWRRRAIVPYYTTKSRKPADQFNAYNTAASRYFGQLINASPAKVDYLIGEYTGGLGTDILRIPEQGIGRAVGFGRFSRSTARGKSINDFYEAKEAADQAYGSAKLRGKVPHKLASLRSKYGRVATKLSGLRKKRDAAETDKEKDAIDRSMTGVCRKALGLEPLEEYPQPQIGTRYNPYSGAGVTR